jgi:hypothetical protein
VLRGEGFRDADTVARFLADESLRERARDGVILIDEAGLVGVPTLQRVFAAAEEWNARVILVGDPKQHRSVEKGDLFRLLSRDAFLPVAEVIEVQRQKGDYRKAVESLSAGDIAGGFERLNRLGFVEEVGAGAIPERIANEYARLTASRKEGGEGKAVLVVSPTHAEGGRIAEAIRDELKRSGRLGEERTLRTWVPLHRTEAERGQASLYSAGEMVQFHRAAPGHQSGSRLVVGEGDVPLRHADRFQVYAPRELAVAAGDRLRVTANGRTKDGRHRLNNGAVVALRAFTAEGDLVLDNGWVVAKEFGHLTHGYVSTSFSSQGRTVDVALVGQSAESYPASSAGQFYVSASRARESLKVFTDDKRELFRAVSREEDRTTATELSRRAAGEAFRALLKELLARARRRGTLLPESRERSRAREREHDR